MTGEQVLTVRRADHFDGAWPQGFVRLRPGEAAAQVAAFERTAAFTPRDAAENDPSLKQLIPYCALTYGDSVFVVERLPAQGETRLHGKRSIGIGGHVNPIDGTPDGAVSRALARELHEEIVVADAAIARAEPIGLINDDATEVGSVHVGVAFHIRLREGEHKTLQVREISKMRGHLGSLAGSSGLWQDHRLLESWSRLLVGGIPEVIGVTGLQFESEGNYGS